jgi:hypothetical protein
MNDEQAVALARAHTPAIHAVVVQGMLRHEVAGGLVGQENVGLELGVARGIFSKRMLDSGKFRLFFGVDLYGDAHDTNEYKSALTYLGLASSYRLLRMTFADALDLFGDGYFDFIYIDGYAHTGEEGGTTLVDWYRKLKVGGILAGDDYHHDWPLVQWAVNDFVSKTGETLHVTGGSENTAYCTYPSWFLKKTRDCEVVPDPILVATGRDEGHRIHEARMLTASSARPSWTWLRGCLDAWGLLKPIKILIRRGQGKTASGPGAP